MPLAVELDSVSYAYRPDHPVLRDVTVQVPAGEFVAIAGPNGGGKTTLLRLIVGLLRAQHGTIRIFGEPVEDIGRRSLVGYLPQRAQLGVDAPVNVQEVVAAGCVSRRRLLGPLRAGERARVDEAIERVGLASMARAPLSTLSGGQQQRAFIAKALAGAPRLLVLDEPTTGVDTDAQEALAELLTELQRDLHVTILYVSHEFGAVEHVAQRLLLIRGGVTFDGAPAELPERWHDPSHVHA
jgi:zinc transport system ATP-binding protein